MSLTSHLSDKESPVRRFLEDQFSIIEQSKRGAPLASRFCTLLGFHDLPRTAAFRSPAPSAYAGIIGTAIDYRLRYYFDSYDCRKTVAFGGAQRMRSLQHSDVLLTSRSATVVPRAAELAAAFFEKHQALVEEIKPVGQRLEQNDEEELARGCIILAYYETVYRAGLAANVNSPLLMLNKKAQLSDLFAIATAACIEDVRRLSWAFFDNQSDLIGLPATLNPTFAGSNEVGGADADVVFGPILLDFKTTSSLDTTKLREAIYQLLGYVMLDYTDKHDIRLLSIVWLRQNHVWKRPLWYFIFSPASVIKMVAENDEPSESNCSMRLKELRTEFRSTLKSAEGRYSLRPGSRR